MRSDYTITSRAACIGILFSGAIILSQPAVSCAAPIDITVPAKIEIISSIEVEKAQDLDFGKVDVVRGGSVILNGKSGSNATTQPKSSTDKVIPTAGTSHPGEITVSSATGIDLRVNVTYPDNGTVISLGASGVELSNMTTYSTASPVEHHGQGDAGSTSIYIGGEVSIGNGTPSGVYSKDINITVDYEPL